MGKFIKQKYCKSGEHLLSETERFQKNGTRHCSICVDKYQRKYYKKNIKKYIKRRAGIKLKQYGLTVESYKELLNKQKYFCAICKNKINKKSWRTHVDHCHKTGKVRGVLCYWCNLGIGLFKENINTLKLAIKYLKKHE